MNLKCLKITKLSKMSEKFSLKWHDYQSNWIHSVTDRIKK